MDVSERVFLECLENKFKIKDSKILQNMDFQNSDFWEFKVVLNMDLQSFSKYEFLKLRIRSEIRILKMFWIMEL